MNVEITEHKGIHFLWIDGKMWMWDLPAEVEIQEFLSQQAYGKVIVAGYGLGILQMFLEDNPIVKEVTTIEKNIEVMNCCKNHYHKIYGGIMILDFYDVIVGEEMDEKPDCVIGDIWPEISGKYLGEYRKFRDKAQFILKPSGKILAWGQEYFEYLLQKQEVIV